MRCSMQVVVAVLVGALAVKPAIADHVVTDPVLTDALSDPLWGNQWVTGGYHDHDLQLSQRVGLSLDWQGTGIHGLSFSYTPKLSQKVAAVGVSPEEPLTFRLTLRGFELWEANTERDGPDFFSFDRIRDREIRKQLLMISVSKRF